jgi:peptide/nickel transport system permease protein
VLTYALKRLLLVIPTFFAISLILFFVLNIAPGRPGADQGGAQGEGQAQEQRESYRIFKEQFHLDKPVLLNTRPWWTTEEVRSWLQVAAGLSESASVGERIAAAERLEDGGEHLVPHLLRLLDDADPVLQQLAVARLAIAAQRPFVNERRGDPAAARAANREIARENEELRGWTWAPGAPPEAVAELRARWTGWAAARAGALECAGLGCASVLLLDTRFAAYWENLLHLDFGVSTTDRRPVFETVMGKLKYSLSLTLVSTLLAYFLAVPMGVFSAVRQGSRADTALTVTLFVLYSLPSFFTGTLLLKLLTEGAPFKLFPTGDFQTISPDPWTTWDRLKDITWHLVLPIVTYTSGSLAALSRYARTGLIEIIRADFIRTARAKGLSEPVVIVKHAVRNGMIPILTLLGGLLPTLVAGSVVIEVIFNIPGMGQYIYQAINLRDYNAVMAVLLTSSLLSLLGILLSDLSYALVDPRISFD